ncbi:hypothetical protein DFH08DRAFT_863968 [Mycena albidolilacea]|uniref:Uncharacterized protein n=1 Tax=Mycena albidolilacea TaxID=1033008 RepID=A0AAD7EU43_9AGAR|nr:hypothetical protein DFH08DRAFT_863968 [Mycena albidolilacea]
MHIISTINQKTQSDGDIPVVLVTLDANSKFLPRPESYEAMDHLVRDYFEVGSRAGLKFEVSSWDVCGGQNVEVTEAAYPFLAPLLDCVSVVVVPDGRNRAMPTPSATPPLRGGDEEIADEQAVQDHLAEAESSNGRATTSPPPRRALKVESEDEDEEVFVGSNYGDDDVNESVNIHDDEEEEHEEEEEEEDAPHARRVLNKAFPSAKKQAKRKIVQDSDEDEPAPVPPARVVVKQEIPAERPSTSQAKPKPKPAPKAHAESSKAPAPKSRGAANRSEDAGESSRANANGSDTDERFKVYVTGPEPDHRAEFMTRGGHLVRKVLAGVCRTFDLDPEHAKLMLCMPLPNGDGEIEVVHFECANDETIARSGVKPNAKLIVRVGYEDEED